MYKAKYILYIVAILSIFLVFSGDSAVASENINTNVSIEPSLTVTIPSTPLVLNLDPSSTTSGSNNLTITVGTNNATGYKTIMTSSSGNTDLVETTDNTLTIPTLASGSYTSPSDFPANHWGYKKDSGSYIPFATNTTILESDTYANDDTTTLSFATKIDYLQASGTYKTTLVFTTTVNPLVDYMQNFTATMCQEKASSADYTVVDKRDRQEYTVRYLAGNCWMTQNLALAAGTTITKIDSNISVDSYTLPTDSTTGYNTDTVAKAHCSGETSTGCWYNYVATTAGTITGTNTDEAQYDICPAGWRLPSYSEQSTLVSLIGTSSSDFNPLPAGFYYANTYYAASGNPTHWWSSTATTTGIRRNIYRTATSTNLLNVSNSPIYGFNVRCVTNN